MVFRIPSCFRVAIDSILQVAEGNAKEKATADARAAKEKVTAREQQQQLQEFQVTLRNVLLKAACIDLVSSLGISGSL